MTKKMPSKSRDSESARTYFRRLPAIEKATRKVLAHMRSLMDAARLFLKGQAKPFSSDELPAFARFLHEYSVQTEPRHRLLAEYIALGETDLWPDIGDFDLDLIEELATGRRATMVTLSNRRYASALRACRSLVAEPFPELEDPYRLEPIRQIVRELFGTHLELGVIVSVEDGTPMMAAEPGLLRDYDQLAFALACGFARKAIPKSSWLSDRHRLLARLLASDRKIPALVRQTRLKVLARQLQKLPKPQDLDILNEELRLEFAAVTSRLPDFISHVEALTELWQTKSTRKVKVSGEKNPRGEYAYQLVCNLKMKLSTAMKMFNDQANKKNWEQVQSVQGLKYIAQSYAEKASKPLPPRRIER